ncbi:MAG: iron complex outermembrane receptor protein [Spirosomataceae bacterium]|jgi:iron complex outermembrane receptor protein
MGLANRLGTADAAGEAADFGASLADVQSFLTKYPDARNVNGSPQTTAMKFAVNAGSKVTATGEVYANAGSRYSGRWIGE